MEAFDWLKKGVALPAGKISLLIRNLLRVLGLIIYNYTMPKQYVGMKRKRETKAAGKAAGAVAKGRRTNRCRGGSIAGIKWIYSD